MTELKKRTVPVSEEISNDYSYYQWYKGEEQNPYIATQMPWAMMIWKKEKSAHKCYIEYDHNIDFKTYCENLKKIITTLIYMHARNKDIKHDDTLNVDQTYKQGFIVRKLLNLL